MNKRNALIISAGLFLLAVAFFIIFISNGTGKKSGDIVLPQGSAQFTENVDIAQRNNNKIAVVTVDKLNVKEIIASLERPLEYELVAEIIYFYEDQNASFTSVLWANGIVQRGQIKTSEGSIERNVLKTGTSLYIWGESGDVYYKGTANQFSMEDEIRMPTYEDILQLEDEEGILSVETTTYEGRFCIHLQSAQNGNFVREWYIDVANALLIACDTKENDKLIYSMRCTSLKVEEQDDELFAVPVVSVPIA